MFILLLIITIITFAVIGIILKVNPDIENKIPLAVTAILAAVLFIYAIIL